MTVHFSSAARKLSCTLLLVLLSGCGGAVLNRSGVTESQLATIESSLQYPHNYSVGIVDGVGALDVSFDATAFGRVDPGKHHVVWMKKTFGDYVASGALSAEFEPGGVYKVGVRKGESLVTIWEIKSGKVISAPLE